MSRTLPTRDGSESGSDMDESSDTEVETYGRHSADSSPQDEISGQRFPGGAFPAAGIANRYAGLGSVQHYYSSDGYSDISSSVDTIRKQAPQMRKPVHSNGYMKEGDEEDGLSDSGGSSDFSSQVERHNDSVTASLRGESSSRNVPSRGVASDNAETIGVPSKVGYSAHNYTHEASSREGVNAVPKKFDVASRGVYHAKSYSSHAPFGDDMTDAGGLSDIPSAPPIHCYDQETAAAPDQMAAARPCAAPHPSAGNGSTNVVSNLSHFYCAVGFLSVLNVLILQIPSFSISLCSLRQILLQSEEELLSKRSPELVSEGAGPKPKKIIGKMKVQGLCIVRYLSYVMDVATPTADCLTLVHDLLLPVILKSRSKNSLSHQENRILGETQEQVEQVLAMVFENYKSLDESLPSGMSEVFRPATGSPAPALIPAMKLFTLLHDILSPEAQLKLCSYFQVWKHSSKWFFLH
ncbi:hypothetical protein BHE74_00004240 [Ensete ventricosum]|nr:hypothetical protein BHE74_00004240 [Ensete ventricosum]